MLEESLAAARREGGLTSTEVKRVNVDTTVQEEAVAFPTDARLYHKARQALGRIAQPRNLKLCQSYVRLGKRALVKQGCNEFTAQGEPLSKQESSLQRDQENACERFSLPLRPADLLAYSRAGKSSR